MYWHEMVIYLFVQFLIQFQLSMEHCFSIFTSTLQFHTLFCFWCYVSFKSDMTATVESCPNLTFVFIHSSYLNLPFINDSNLQNSFLLLYFVSLYRILLHRKLLKRQIATLKLNKLVNFFVIAILIWNHYSLKFQEIFSLEKRNVVTKCLSLGILNKYQS